MSVSSACTSPSVVDVGPGEPLVVRLADDVTVIDVPALLEDGAVLGQLRLVRLAAVVEAGRDVDLERHLPRTHRTIRTSRCRSVATVPRDRHEVDDLADARLGHEPGDQDGGVGEVELLAGERLDGRADPEVTAALAGPAAPPKMLGESNRGAQNQSMEPSVATSAAVWRSPIRPWSAISGYSSIVLPFIARAGR